MKDRQRLCLKPLLNRQHLVPDEDSVVMYGYGARERKLQMLGASGV